TRESQAANDSSNRPAQITELLSEHGFNDLNGSTALLKEPSRRASRRSRVQPSQRAKHLTGLAEGGRTIPDSAPLTVEMSQIRGLEFYPSGLAWGTRSERALKLAAAEMYMQGVSTRKVDAIIE